MEANVFKVDLGDLQLNDEQRGSINSAIQKAVLNQLAEFSFPIDIIFRPIDQWRHRYIINGIMPFELAKLERENLLDAQ